MYCFRMVTVLLLLVIVQNHQGTNRLKQTRFLERYIEKEQALPSSDQNWMSLRTDANINPVKFLKNTEKHSG